MSNRKQKHNRQTDDDEAVRKYEEKYRTLFDSIGEGFVIAELLVNEEDKAVDLLVLETNPSFDRMMRATDAVKKRVLESFSGAEASRFEPYARVIETGERLRFENYLAALDRWFELYISRVGGEGSRRVAIVFNDITARKRAEEELRRSEERLHLIVESARGFAIFTTEADGVINSWNTGAEQVFGWSEAEILGQMTDVMFTPEDRASGEPQKELGTARAQGIAPDIRWHLRKDGSRVFIDGEVRPLRDEQPIGFAKIGRDVTAQRQAEEALREHQKQLQFLNETLEQKVEAKTAEVHQLTIDLIDATQRERERISRVLHDDVQQRIYAIQMQLSFVKGGLPMEHDTGRRHISEVENELSEIVQITRNLSIDLSPPLPPGEGLAHALEWLIIRMQEQYGLAVELQADGPFLIPKAELHVLLFNCVRELLFNVVKHAGASRAVVALDWVENGIQIEVRDDGKGFPETVPEKKASKQASLPRSIGIPTIRHQLSLFRGSLQINSKPGVGTQIVLVVPITSARQEVVHFS